MINKYKIIFLIFIIFVINNNYFINCFFFKKENKSPNNDFNNNNNNNEEINNFKFNKFEIDKKLQDRINNGKESLELIKRNSISNRCWEECIDILINGCKELDDLSKSRLAVKLTNCHLAKSGFPTYRCTYDMSIEECTNKMDQLSFVTYTNFYISTENICYYLSQELFQERTEQSINQLIDSTIQSIQTLDKVKLKSNKISDQIEHSIENQQLLIENQIKLKESISTNLNKLNELESKSKTIHTDLLDNSEKQSILLDNNLKFLKDYKENSKNTLSLINDIKLSSDQITQQTKQSLDTQFQLMESQSNSEKLILQIESITNSSLSKLKNLIEFQDQLFNTNQIIINILNQLNFIQSWILSEVVDFKSIYYYIFSLVLIYLLSSYKKLKSTRIPLILGLILNIFLEKYLSIYLLSNSNSNSNSISNNNLLFILNYLNSIPIINSIWNKFNFLNFINNNNNNISNQEYIYLIINNIRILFIIYSILILFFSFWFYKDYEKENHKLLLSILNSIQNLEKKNQKLKKSLYDQGLLKKSIQDINEKQEKNYSLIKIND